MSELEEAMASKDAEVQDWEDTRVQNDRESQRRLREFRDLMMSGYRLDQAYSLDFERTWVGEKRRLFGKPVPGHNQYHFDFKPAVRGWILWGSVSDRTGDIGGEFLSEDLRLFRFSESPRPVVNSEIFYRGLAEHELVPSSYFPDRKLLIVLGDQLEGVHRWHGTDGVEALAGAARHYRA